VKALVKTARGPGNLELRDVPRPEPLPKWVRVRVAYGGICGTDLHILHDTFPYWPPVILGHEFTGTVEALGEGVDPAWMGRRVVCEPHSLACGECYLCRRGHIQLCAAKRSPGWGIDGAFASHVAVPAMLLHRVPDSVPDRVAALAEPMAIVLSAMERAPVRPGDAVVIMGPGPVGILAALAARATGAGPVLIVGRDADKSRLDAAGRLGFDTAGDPEAARAWTADATESRGADMVIDASGAAVALALGVEILRRRGRLLAVGMGGRPDIPFPWDLAVTRALDIAFSMSSNYTAWDPAIGMLARHADAAASLVTEFALSDWQAAFRAVEEQSVLKAIIRPDGGASS